MPKALTSEHIMVLNDTADLLDLFEALLTDEGYRVTLGALMPGELARLQTTVRTEKPDLLILDFLVGGEPVGWQFLQMLRMDRATVALPIIICTAAVRQVEELSAHLATMNVGVVIKPFDIDSLLDEIRRLLAQSTVTP